MPTSPEALATPSRRQEKSVLETCGTVTKRNVPIVPHPRVRAASSSLRSSGRSIAAWRGRTTSGSPATNAERITPGSEKTMRSPSQRSMGPPMGPFLPNSSSSRKPIATGGKISGSVTRNASARAKRPRLRLQNRAQGSPTQR